MNFKFYQHLTPDVITPVWPEKTDATYPVSIAVGVIVLQPKESLNFWGTEGHCKKFKGNCRKRPCNTVPAPSSSLPESSGFASHKPNPKKNLASCRVNQILSTKRK